MSHAVEMRGISRQFGAVQALDCVDFSVEKGEIHALVGENGAGKTSLMRILYGSDRPDSGHVRVFGKDVRFTSAAEGIAAGIGMVSQHYSIIPELTCLENLILGAEPSQVIDFKAAQTRADELAAKMGFEFDWHEVADKLSPAAAQKLEILKLLWRNAEIMVLDEPTAMLSPADSDALFESLKQLAQEGATVIVVTHRLPEVLEHSHRVTVLRGGRLIEARDVAGTTANQLAELIVGRPVALGRRATPSAGSITGLTVRQLTVKGYRGNDAVVAANLEVRLGEVVGIAGVDGSGQRELFWALAGLQRPTSGTVALHGTDVTELSAAERILLGVRLIPEDRHAEGVVDHWSLYENSLVGLQRLDCFHRGPWIAADKAASHAAEVAARFSTKHGGLSEPIGSLSGGNQQRFVSARAISEGVKLLLAFQPARGLDIDATRNVYEGIGEVCRRGACALVVSFDLDELLDYCDRVVAMNSGQIFEPEPDKSLDRARIGELMVVGK